MHPPPPAPGSQSSARPQTLKLLALAVFLLPWAQFATATGEQQAAQQAAIPKLDRRRSGNVADGQDGPDGQWATTPLAAAQAARHTQGYRHNVRQKSGQILKQHERGGEYYNDNDINFPDDASALATLAPAQSVRAPRHSRQNKPSSIASSGLASPQIARSLEDWEVEDFVLLATVDGDLYASDRKTGKQRWHLEVELPMVETKHYRTNNSVLDDDYSPVDHYIWAVEPNRDGGLYVWIPDSDVGVVRTGFTMKRLVEELAPYADEDPPVVYTGDKKTTMITLDAATGRILKLFGAGGSIVNEDERCLRPNPLYGLDSEECSSTGTITLGRTEYTVGIQRRDGRPIATLKYSEWSPNTFDSDLYQQYHYSLDSQYITSQHDGKVYAFDYGRTDKAAPLFSHKFSTPVARVFDVCRPWDAPPESNPELIVLPQPPMPSEDEKIARMRSNSIFLNQTEAGSWYAMSGRSYPLIIDAPAAQVSREGWWDVAPTWDTISQAKIDKALIGTHLLEAIRGGSTGSVGDTVLALPPGTNTDSYLTDPDNESALPIESANTPLETTIITKVKSLPQTAANSLIDFVSNPVLIIIFFVLLIYNEHKIRRTYNEFLYKAGIKEPLQPLYPPLSHSSQVDAAGDEADAKSQESEGLTKAISVESIDSKPDASDSGVDLPVKHDAQPADETPNGVLAEKKPLDEPDKSGEGPNGGPLEKKKKGHRGRRGGVKHKKGKNRDVGESQDDKKAPVTVEEAIDNAKKMAEPPEKQQFKPDEPHTVTAIPDDPNAVTPSVVKMGSIEVNTDEQLGSGSNGTLVFSGKFDGRDVAVKRMLIQFYDIASQETRLLRESDDHPNGRFERDQ